MTVEAESEDFDAAKTVSFLMEIGASSVEVIEKIMSRKNTTYMLIALSAALLLAGCSQGSPSKDTPIHLNPNMDYQPKYQPQEASGFFPDGAMRTPVPGTVARGELHEDTVYYTGKNSDGTLVKTSPVEITAELLDRGEERFNIYCSVCHSRVGDGKGIITEYRIRPAVVAARRADTEHRGRPPVRRHHERHPEHAVVPAPDTRRGPVGDRRLHPRAAAKPKREAVGHPGRVEKPFQTGPESMKYDGSTFRLTDTGGLPRLLFIIGGAGLALTFAGWIFSADQFFFSYLTGFAYWWTLAMGGLFFTMLHHLTNATWSVVLRRIAESFMSVLPWFALLFVPLLFGLNNLYIWSVPEIALEDHIIHGKVAYLNDTFFVIRTVIFFAAWTVLTLRLRKLSFAQDAGHTESIRKSFGKTSAVGMIFFALTLTFASFDWMMSLDPHWFSTIYGVYIFGGMLLSFLSLVTVTGRFLQGKGVLTNAVTAEHFHDLARLMFAFTIFWAYIAFSQYFLIWYGNIPEETLWFLHRWEGSWKVPSILLLFGHFIIPFLALMLRAVKRSAALTIALGIWILIMHWVDIYWLVMPSLHHHSAHLSWMDFTAFVGFGGLFLGLALRNFSRRPLVPVGDPRLLNSINFKH